MEKYGYEKEQHEDGVKEAVRDGLCPICGQALSGTPPVCPEHGSEPFERRDDAEE